MFHLLTLCKLSGHSNVQFGLYYRAIKFNEDQQIKFPQVLILATTILPYISCEALSPCLKWIHTFYRIHCLKISICTYLKPLNLAEFIFLDLLHCIERAYRKYTWFLDHKLQSFVVFRISFYNLYGDNWYHHKKDRKQIRITISFLKLCNSDFDRGSFDIPT